MHIFCRALQDAPAGPRRTSRGTATRPMTSPTWWVFWLSEFWILTFWNSDLSLILWFGHLVFRGYYCRVIVTRLWPAVIIVLFCPCSGLPSPGGFLDFPIVKGQGSSISLRYAHLINFIFNLPYKHMVSKLLPFWGPSWVLTPWLIMSFLF